MIENLVRQDEVKEQLVEFWILQKVKVMVQSLRSDIYAIFNRPVTFLGTGHTPLEQSHFH